MPFTPHHGIQTAKPADYPQLIEVLIKAFDADPHIAWLIRRDEKRAIAYRQFFTMMLNGLAQPHGEIYTTGNLNSVALWYPPGRGKIGFLKQAKVAPAFIRAVGWNSLFSRMVGIEKMEYHHPREPHYYLQLLGVDPDHQGQGAGRALLKPMLHKCDALQTCAI
jgi:ribosomal protein S18 acetylase RimI-like enzyme